MTPETLASISGIALSLLFSYIPGFKTWYEPLSTDSKRLVMLALLLVTTLVTFGLACANLSPEIAVACDTAGAWGLFKVFVAAVIANQATFLISPKGNS